MACFLVTEIYLQATAGVVKKNIAGSDPILKIIQPQKLLVKTKHDRINNIRINYFAGLKRC